MSRVSLKERVQDMSSAFRFGFAREFFQAFVNDPLVRLPLGDAKKLFDEMIENTKRYL